MKKKNPFCRPDCPVALAIQVDDTGARHAGKNGYCTSISNEVFAWFGSTGSKSRINFLTLLRQGYEDYHINENALDYMRAQGLPKFLLERLEENHKCLANKEDWEKYLSCLGITSALHQRVATEGALIGSILSHGFYVDMAILSDDAGQFNVFAHALCWIHSERTLKKLLGISDKLNEAMQGVLDRFWSIYKELKAYKKQPSEALKKQIEKSFDELCEMGAQRGGMLRQALKRIKDNKKELLLVLQRPEIPLHNNLSEGDIREYGKRRKISGGTRNEKGRRCRDTFASLKKTCRKLGVSFWHYLGDRITSSGKILPLSDLIHQAARESPAGRPAATTY